MVKPDFYKGIPYLVVEEENFHKTSQYEKNSVYQIWKIQFTKQLILSNFTLSYGGHISAKQDGTFLLQVL